MAQSVDQILSGLASAIALGDGLDDVLAGARAAATGSPVALECLRRIEALARLAPAQGPARPVLDSLLAALHEVLRGEEPDVAALLDAADSVATVGPAALDAGAAPTLSGDQREYLNDLFPDAAELLSRASRAAETLRARPDASALETIQSTFTRIAGAVREVGFEPLVAIAAAAGAALERASRDPRRHAPEAARLTGEAAQLITALFRWAIAPIEGASPGPLPACDELRRQLEAFPGSADAAPKPPAAPPAEEPPLSIAPADRTLLADFLFEARELLNESERRALALEGSHDPDDINGIFRAFHTIKGGGALLRLAPITELAHIAESLLDETRAGHVTLSSALVDLTLATIDSLRALLEWVSPLQGGEPPRGPRPDTRQLRARLQAMIAAAEEAPEPPRPEEPARALETLAEHPAAHPSAAPTVPLDASPRAPAADGRAQGAEPPRPASPSPNRQDSELAGLQAALTGSSVKVDTGKLDQLADLVGELVIAYAMVADDESLRSVQAQQTFRNLSQLARVTKDLQRGVMSLRMVSIRATFDRIVRAARDAARVTGKQITLDVTGGDTELDRTMVEMLYEPLLHMVRNAVDHGIEPEQDRERAGKPAQGRVGLRAYHEGGQIVVELSDDGRGLDPAKLVAKGREKGLLGPDEVPPDQQAYALIFAPGFSTAATVTGLSGRGVGMDVVKNAIDRLRGRIEIDSRVGVGTTFRLRLPLTLAIIDALIVKVGPERFVLPAAWAREIVRVRAGDLFVIRGQSRMVKVRNQHLPVISLGDLFALDGAARNIEDSLLIIVESRGTRVCLQVDDLVGKQEVVIKTLGPLFGGLRDISGGSILSDGRIGLILDVESLVGRIAGSAA